MSETATAIIDAAERRIRAFGYHGFSFREIAADTGVKSSSVHYHFPTKEALAAAVARRYTLRFAEAVEAEMAAGYAVKAAWQKCFRQSLRHDGKMCLCGALAVTSHDLSDEVTREVRAFFEQGLAQLTSAGLTIDAANQLLAQLEGAMLLATILNDFDAFDRATVGI